MNILNDTICWSGISIYECPLNQNNLENFRTPDKFYLELKQGGEDKGAKLHKTSSYIQEKTIDRGACYSRNNHYPVPITFSWPEKRGDGK